MIQCIVESCESNSNSDLQTSVTFFDFPRWKDSERFNKWVEALGRSPEYFKQKGKFICSRHFRLEDFQQKYDESLPDIKCSLRLLENAVPSLYLCEDNKNFTRLPVCDTKTEAAPIMDVSFIKTEEGCEEGFSEADQVDSASNNSSIIINEMLFKEEPQEETKFELTAEDHTSKESERLAVSKNPPAENLPSFQVTQTKNNELVTKKFTCWECKETFSWSTELKKHKRVAHGTYVCNICLKHVVNLASLRVHKRTKHNISFVFNCEDCDEAFFKNRELLKHMKIHKKVPTDRCTKCKKKFDSDAECLSHDCIKRKKLFQCEICRRCFAGEKTLDTHKNKFHLENSQIREEEKKYECDVCNKTLKRRHGLIQHKRLHEKPYQCNTCKKEYSDKASLKVHQLNHSAVECIHLGHVKL